MNLDFWDNLGTGLSVLNGVATGVSIMTFIIPIVCGVISSIFLIVVTVLIFVYGMKRRMVNGKMRCVCRKSTKGCKCFKNRARSYPAYLVHKAEKERM